MQRPLKRQKLKLKPKKRLEQKKKQGLVLLTSESTGQTICSLVRRQAKMKRQMLQQEPRQRPKGGWKGKAEAEAQKKSFERIVSELKKRYCESNRVESNSGRNCRFDFRNHVS